jgi:hypothetical protein
MEHIASALSHYDLRECIAEDDHVAMYRAMDRRTAKPLIVKFSKSNRPPLELTRSFRMEYEWTRRFLEGALGILIPEEIEDDHGRLVIRFADFDGVPASFIFLGTSENRSDISTFLKLAFHLVDALDEIHRRGEIVSGAEGLGFSRT